MAKDTDILLTDFKGVLFVCVFSVCINMGNKVLFSHSEIFFFDSDFQLLYFNFQQHFECCNIQESIPKR